MLVAVFSLLVALAMWQLQRATTKTRLQQHLLKLEQQGATPLENWQALSVEAADGIRVKHSGRWLAPYAWLLDNQVLNNRIGYDLIIPVQLYGSSRAVLVNLGWVAAPVDRAHLPTLAIPEHIQVTGIIRSHWGGLTLGQNVEDKNQWPMRIQKVDIVRLGAYLPLPLYPALIYQLQHSPFQIHYQAIVMSPERHRAYALQWALLALAVVIIALTASAKPLQPGQTVKKGISP